MEYLPRIADAALDELLASSPIVMVDGARATGKTTSAARVSAAELRLPGDLPVLSSDPSFALSNLQHPALIDEWQLADVGVLWVLKDIVDRRPLPGSFVLTGSVEPETYGATYPLTGRAGRVTWRPMNRRELLGEGAARLWLDRLLAGELFRPGTSAAPTDFELLMHSGLPATRKVANPVPQLLAYADTIALRGVDERRDPAAIGRLLRVLATVEGQAVPDERIWQAANIDRATLVRYRALLERTHMIQPLPAWHSNRLKRLTARAKQFLADTAIALAIAGVSVDQLRNDPTMAGPYLESFVLCQLRPEVDRMRGSLYHLRDKAGEHEIDVIIDIGGRIVALETKATVRPTVSDGKHLAWLRAQLGNEVAATAVLHRGTSTWELSPGIWAIPISTLWDSSE